MFKNAFKGVLLIFIIIRLSPASVTNKDIIESREKINKAFYAIMQYYADDVDPEALAKAAILGMTESLDPYTEYLEKSRKFQMDLLTTGQYGGVGVRIGIRNDTLTVISPMEGTPGWRMGFLPGDRIMKIDSVSTIGMNLNDASGKIRGAPGEPVTLTIYRYAEREMKDVTIVREIIHLQEVSYAGFIEPGIVYIKLNGFSKDASDEIKDTLNRFKKDGIDALILDLRNNSGGLLTEAIDILNLYINSTDIAVSTRGQNPRINREYALNRQTVIDPKTRVAILINGGSASASEIVAGVTQDLDRGIIVGTASFGKGLVQNIISLDDSSSLKLTTSKYYIPSGRMIQKEDYFEKSKIILKSDEVSIEYYTRGGRKMPNNGGIVPDTLVESEIMLPAAADIWNKGYYFDFARNFSEQYSGYDNNKNRDELFNHFTRYLNEKSYVYKSPDFKSIEKLEKELRTVHALDGETEALIQGIKKRYFEKTETYLLESKEQILRMLHMEIHGFLQGEYGRINAGLQYDDVLKTAIELIRSDDYPEKLGIVDD
jgi:carboxyl-terminal processing protease